MLPQQAAVRASLGDRVLSEGSEPSSAKALQVSMLPQQAAGRPAVFPPAKVVKTVVLKPGVLQPTAVQLQDSAHLIEDVTLPPGHTYISPS